MSAPPPVNIPPKVRFGLYLAGAVASPVVAYLVTKDWAGEPEQTLVFTLAGLLNLLAAAKTPLREEPEQSLSGRP